VSLDAGRARGLARFLRLAAGLKELPRTGWLDRGVPAARAESVAEHSFQTALLAWTAASADPSLNRDRLLRLALVHDLAEALIGDWTPYDQRDIPDRLADPAGWRAFLERRHRRLPERRAAKRAAEQAATAQLLALLGGNLRVEIAVLLRELEEGQSAEARFLKQAELLETWLQSRVYAASDPGLPMASFAADIDEAITHPALVALRDAAREG
jgi:putative hydrolase of HD superfamily